MIPDSYNMSKGRILSEMLQKTEKETDLAPLKRLIEN